MLFKNGVKANLQILTPDQQSAYKNGSQKPRRSKHERKITREVLSRFDTLCLEEQIAFVDADKNNFFRIPKEHLRTEHLAATFGHNRDLVTQKFVQRAGFYEGRYLLKALSYAPRRCHTHYLLVLAAIGKSWIDHKYNPTEKNTPRSWMMKPIFDGHPLVDKRFALHLVDLNPWLVASIPENLLDEDVRKLAQGRLLQLGCVTDVEYLLNLDHPHSESDQDSEDDLLLDAGDIPR